MSLRPAHVPTPPHRMRCRSTMASCVLAATVAAMTHAAAADIRVFTDRHHAVEAPAGVHVVELDAPARIEAELAANLSTDPAQASAIVRQRLQDGGTPLQRRLADAYQGAFFQCRWASSPLRKAQTVQVFFPTGMGRDGGPVLGCQRPR